MTDNRNEHMLKRTKERYLCWKKMSVQKRISTILKSVKLRNLFRNELCARLKIKLGVGA